jgi:2-dehydropantoate 2-reductase
MKITIAGGAGAMGSIFGGRLFQKGHDVLLYDVAEKTVQKINREGLRILDKDQHTEVIRVKSSCDPSDAKGSDLVIVFTKCFHTEDAIKSLLPFLSGDARILSLQNGWGNAQTISKITGRERLLIGVNYVSGTVLEPGFVKQVGNPLAYIGRWGLPTDSFTRSFSEILSETGIQTKVSDQVITEIWKKLALNVVSLPTAALLKFQAHLLIAYQPVAWLMEKLLAETIAVAKAQQIELEYEERHEAIRKVLENAVGAKGSMLQDAEAGRKTEIDVINGAIVEAGKQWNVPTPFNECMFSLVKAMEQDYLKKDK